MKKETKETSTRQNKNMKIIILVLAIVSLLILIPIFFVIINNKNDVTVYDRTDMNSQEDKGVSLIDYKNTNNIEIVGGKKKNVSTALLENRTFEGLNIKNIKLEAEDGMTSFTATIENKTDKDFKNCIVVLIFIDEDGTEYARLEASIPDIIQGKSTVLDASTTSDLSNAFNFKIEEI